MSQSVPEASLRRIGGAPTQQRRVGIGRWAVLSLAALATAFAAVTITAAQITERETAEALLSRVGRALFEIDAVAVAAWDELTDAAAEGEPLSLGEFPLTLELSEFDLAAGPSGLADILAARAARSLYDGGFDALLEEPRGVTDFFSDISVFAGTIGRLTSGGRTLASVALIVSLCLFVPLALGALAQGRGVLRFLYLGAALGAGGLLALVAGVVAEARFNTLRASAADPLLAEIYAVGVEVSALLTRNAGIVAILGAALIAVAVLADQLERRI